MVICYNDRSPGTPGQFQGVILSLFVAGTAGPRSYRALEERIAARQTAVKYMTRYIIRKVRLAHCKKGPDRCEKCREMDVGKICLLDVCPPRERGEQRRVIEVTRAGDKVWCEFDIVRVFESEGEAAEYAAQNGIEDVEL